MAEGESQRWKSRDHDDGQGADVESQVDGADELSESWCGEEEEKSVDAEEGYFACEYGEWEDDDGDEEEPFLLVVAVIACEFQRFLNAELGLLLLHWVQIGVVHRCVV